MLRLGKLLSRTGTTPIIFGYNGRDGVVTDSNGLIYMRARYYSPEMRRFINADIIPGEISNAITLNRFAYANGNPVSNVDPFGLSAERGSAGKDYLDMRRIFPRKHPRNYAYGSFAQIDPFGPIADRNRIEYDKKYYNSEAYKKIKNNANAILEYSRYYDVDPQTVAAIIFTEQYYNYNWIDVYTDWISMFGIIDMSVGLSQVRISTAKYLEENGYITETSANEWGIKIPIIGFIAGTETMALEKRLEDDDWNIMYATAYVRLLEDLWKKDFPEIEESPDILGALYNLGHYKEPHNNPQANSFGVKTEYFYKLMGEALQ